MMEIVLIVSILSSFGLVFYSIQKGSADRIETIQEMSKIFLAKNMEEYVETIQEDNEEEVQIEPDEFEDINAVDERLLIEHLKSDENN